MGTSEQAYNFAADRHQQAFEVLTKTQLEAATQRTSFFEKIAIGSGATIAALVSFLGTHAAGLHPHWVLRCSLVSLAIAMVSALYRNYMYPHYQVSANARQF
jgi:hypothetical protein